MRLTARLVASLVLSAALVSGAWTWFAARAERGRLTAELDHRGALLAETLRDSVEPLVSKRDRRGLERLLSRYAGRSRLRGAAVHAPDGTTLHASDGLPPATPPMRPETASECDRLPGTNLRRCALALEGGDGFLAVYHDAARVDEAVREVWRRGFWRLLTQAILLAVITLWVLRLDLLAPLDAMTDWMRRLRAEGLDAAPPQATGPLASLASEAAGLARSLTAARAAAEEEARLRHRAQSVWTP